MKERTVEGQARECSIPLIGRRKEVEALASALSGRQSCLMLGPAGIGKTRLIQEAMALSRPPCVCIEQPMGMVLHQLLVELAGSLGCSGRLADFQCATSLALKAMVWEALRATPRCIVLEDMADADPRMYRFLQRVYYIPGVCLIVTARSRSGLGHLRKLLWDPREEIALGPLNRAESLALFEAASRECDLGGLDLDGFRRQALAAARGSPGQIQAMCRLACHPQYRNGRHIKFLPLRMDALPAFV